MKKEENSYCSENGIKQHYSENRTIQKHEQGITLVALVVTIIVLLILAAVTLNLIGGANGILSRAQNAASEMKLAQLKEALELSNTEKVMDKYAEGEYLQDLYDYIKEKCEEDPDKTVDTSNGTYWLDDDGNMHYKCKEPDTGAELEKDKNGNPAIKDTGDDEPSGGDKPGGDDENPLPTLIKGDNVDFEYTPKGWTNGSVTVKVVPKNVDITGCTIQTSKDGVNWEDTDTQTFDENGTLHVRLVKGTQKGDEITEEINNIDITKPVVIKVDGISNGITITAKDEESGIVGYLVTDNENEPAVEDFIACGNTKAFEKSVTEIANGTHYVWVIDEARNISQGKTVEVGVDEEPLPTLIKGDNVDFEYTPKGWTNGSVTVQVVPKNLDITGCTIQTSKDGVNWEDTDTQTFDENGTLHVRLVKGTQEGDEITEEINNIDTTAPEVTEVVAETNRFVFKAKDEGSGIAGYAITETNAKPTNFMKVNDNPKEFQELIENKKNNITYYIWVQDAVGNVSEKAAVVNLKAVENAGNTNITVGETTWNGINATVPFSTTSSLAIQWCTTQSTNDADWTTGTSATVPSGTTIYVRLWDGVNGGTSYLAHTPILTYQVKYNANGGTGTMANSTHEYGKEKALTANGFNKTGYAFTGWATSASGAKVYDNNQGVTNLSTTNGDVVNLYAVWTANTNTAYKVVHQQMNVSGSGYTVVATDSKTGTTDANVTPPVNTYTGFTSPSTQTVKIAADGSTTVTYSYTRNKYKFTLGSSTGVTTTGSTATGDYYFGATITLKATCTGYAWKQWTSSNTSLVGNLTTANTTFTMPAGDVSMIPSATINSWTVSYNANGGSGEPGNQTKYYGQTLTLSSTKPTRSGYTFLGWSTSNTATSATYAAGGSYTANSGATLYAVWKEDLKPATEVITGTNYGDKVNYSAAGETDWLIYLNQGGHIYIIPKITVSNDGFIESSSVTKSGEKSVCCDSREDFLEWMNTESYWTNFASGYPGATAKGGPTGQQWVDSWNAKGYEPLSITTDGSLAGCQVITTFTRQDGKALGTTTTLSTSLGKSDQLYFPTSGSTGYSYWFINPKNASTTSTMVWGTLSYQKTVTTYGKQFMTLNFRPLVCLPSNATMKWNGSAWDLIN